MSKLQRLRSFSHRIMSEITPGDAAWRGAAFGVFVLVAVIVLIFFATFFVQDFSWQKLPAFPAGFGALVAIGILVLGTTFGAVWINRSNEDHPPPPDLREPATTSVNTDQPNPGPDCAQL